MRRKPTWHSAIRAVLIELEPVVAHAAVGIVVLGSLLAFGAICKLLQLLFEDHKEDFALLERVDIWIAIAIISVFSAAMLFRVCFRLWIEMRRELNDHGGPK